MTTRDINYAMHNYLPRYYEDIREANAIVDAESAAIEKLNFDAKDVLAQFFVDTATWGLASWERLAGDKYAGIYDRTSFDSLQENNVTYSEVDMASWAEFESKYPTEVAQRRSNVKARIRGTGTVTVALIRSVAESYANGQVDVIEDSANYTITIKFVGEYGAPAKISDIQKVLRDIIPAHLAIEYAFTYVLYDQAKSTYSDYDALSVTGYTYSQLLTNGG